jgi:putative transposase
MSQAQKTIRQKVVKREGISTWLQATHDLFNRLVAFYFDVIQAHALVLDLPNKQTLTALEKLTHQTAKNPHPVMPLAEVCGNVPAMFRRAAINTAIGMAQSFYANRRRWLKQKEKAEDKGKKCHIRPPVPPRAFNRSPVLYAGMWKERVGGKIMLKVWDGKTWRWVKFRLQGRGIPDGWQMGSPQLVRKGNRWMLHTPVTLEFERPKRAQVQLENNPTARVCAVDLNINDSLAVCTILQADGIVVATHFIRGGKALQSRRKRLLGMVARNRRQTGIIAEDEQDNAALWRKIRAIDEDAAHQVSKRIVSFAHVHGANLIVFEHLGNFRPKKGSYSRRGNEKRAYWLRGKIVQYARYKAWERGMLTCRVSPYNTSRACAYCGGKVARYGVGDSPTHYQPGAPLFRCPACAAGGNADRNASLNIGLRFFARYGLIVGLGHRKASHSLADGRQVSKETGVLRSQAAGNGCRPHAEPERHGEGNGHGTAQLAAGSAVSARDGIPRPLRSETGSGYAAITRSPAHAGVPEEAAPLEWQQSVISETQQGLFLGDVLGFTGTHASSA